MDILFLKEVLIPISTIVTLLSISVGSLIAVFAYRLNLRAEARLKESAKAEIDVKLLELMVNLIQKANGRSGYEISHDTIRKILDSEQIEKLDFLESGNNKVLNQILQDSAILTLPVGSAEQYFSIKAIGELGLQHNFLKSISLASINELSRIPGLKDLCEELIIKLEPK